MKKKELNELFNLSYKEAILEIVNKYAACDISKISQESKLVKFRQIYYKILRDKNYSFYECGELCDGRSGSKNHSTIINQIQQCEIYLKIKSEKGYQLDYIHIYDLVNQYDLALKKKINKFMKL